MSYHLDENIPVTMRDGIRLSVDIFRPTEPGKFPALLAMSPYGKERQRYPPHLTFRSVEAGNIDYFASRGYVYIIADCRGSAPSEGRWALMDQDEQQDGYDLIEWIARQPWCNGRVAMMGESYFAVIQFLVAATQPPSLKTIVPFDGWTDLYRDTVYHGGVHHRGFQPWWLAETYDYVRPALGTEPPEKWLPPQDVLLSTIMNPVDGPYYWERSSYTKFDRIKVPVYYLVCNSPFFNHRRGQLRAYTEIDTPKKLLVGPGPPGLLFYSEAVCEQIRRWLDCWLKDIDTGIMSEPPVTLYVDNSEGWRYEGEYPLARTKWSQFYLRSGESGTAAEPPYGLLSGDSPGDEKPDSYSYPESWRQAEANLPVLGFGTATLADDLEVVGPASLTLYAAATTDDVHWMLKIDDVAPDGSVTVVSKGWLKASHREVDEARSRPGQPFHPHLSPTPIEPGRVYRYDIEIWPMFRRFRRGHRLRLRIANCESRTWDPHNFHAPIDRPVTNTIYHDREHPSHLLLPVIPPGPVPTNLRPSISYQPPR